MSDIHHIFNLKGRTAMVTGGVGLLGSQFCRTLATAGAKVTIADLDDSAASLLAKSIRNSGGIAEAFRVDVTQPSSVSAVVEQAVSLFGSLDILVNSAALDPKFDPKSLAGLHENQLNDQADPKNFPNLTDGSFESFPLESWNKAIDVNLTGAFLCCQAAGKVMLEQENGVIVNVSSIYGIVGPDQRIYRLPDKPPLYKPVYYSVSKAGILGLTRYLAAYYAGKNIRVNALTPGGVFNGHDEAFVTAYSTRTILGRMAEVDELNGSLLFLVSDASAYMTGANLVVDGGWSAW